MRKSIFIVLILLLGSCIQLTMPPVDTYIATLLSLAKIKNTAKILPPTLVYSGSPYSFIENLPVTTTTPAITETITSCTASPALPAGLVLNTTTCSISGSPTTLQAAADYTITASNSAGSAAAVISIAVIIAPPTALTYPASSYTFTQNSPITTQTPTFNGTITNCISSPALPSGLTINTSTCAISGSPTVIQSATNYTITASNTSGNTTAVISITINLAPPTALTYSASPYTFPLNVTITTVTPTVTGTVSNCVSAPTLPAGLNLNTTTCAISGMPTTQQAATSYTITASNAFGNTTATISITVNLAPPSALTFAGSPYMMTKNVTITTITPTVTGTVTSCTSSPTLPTGLSINATTCAISGMPTVWQAAANYTITASNSAGSTTASISLSVTSNGSTWTARTLPTSSSFYFAVAYGNGIFVAITYNSATAATSTDGINWTARTMPGNRWESITYGNGYFVAVATGPANVSIRSTDGINWTVGTMPYSAHWSSVTYGNGYFVAIARNAANYVARSSDGITWTAGTLPSGQWWRWVTFGNGVFVAVSVNSTGAGISSDGINWTPTTLPTVVDWYSVTYGNGVFVAIGRNSAVAASSTDGINWTQRSLPSFQLWYSVTYGNGVFVAVANSSAVAATSTDGINWTARTLPSSQPWISVTYGNGVFVTVAQTSNNAASSQ